MLAGQRYDDGVEAIVEAATHYGDWDGFRDAVAGATTLPDELTVDAFLEDPAAHLPHVPFPFLATPSTAIESPYVMRARGLVQLVLSAMLDARRTKA